MDQDAVHDLDLPDPIEISVGRLPAPSENFPIPLTGQSSRLLPLLDLGGGHFESFGLEAVAHLDGLTEARVYGRSGQTQHGIDVYGRRSDGQAAVYQMRCRDQILTAEKLRKAVKHYFDGSRPHDADAFELCWARRVDDTAIDDELRQLRIDYPDQLISLRDQARFTSELITNRLLVLRWFGEVTTNNVYGAFAEAPSLRRAYDTDGLLRGPLAAFYLAGDLQDALELRDSEPEEAAARLRAIAETIEARGYIAHAADVRAERLTALVACGQVEAAFLEVLAAFELHVDQGGPARYFPELRRLENLRSMLTGGALPPARPLLAGDPAPPLPEQDVWPVDRAQIQRCQVLLGVDAAEGSLIDVGKLRDATLAFAASAGGPRDGVMAALRRLSEIALLAEDRDTLATIDAKFTALEPLPVARTAIDEDDEIRLRLAIADGAGQHSTIESMARYGVLPQRLVGVAHARRARWHSWNAAPNQAREAWFEAIQAAGSSAHREDAADYLWALRSVDTAYHGGLPSADAIEYGRRAQAVNPQGRAFFARSQTEIDALRAIRTIASSSTPTTSRRYSTHRLLKRLLFESVIRADLVGEVDAHHMLAEFHLQQSEAAEALLHAIRAGHIQTAAAAAESLGADALTVIDGAPAAPWCTRASLAAFNVIGDVITRAQLVAHLPKLRGYLAVRVDRGWSDNAIRDLAMSALEVIAYQMEPSDADMVRDTVDPYLNDQVRQTTMRAAVRTLARMLSVDPDSSILRSSLLEVIKTLPAYVAQDVQAAGNALAALTHDLEQIATHSDEDISAAIELLAYLGVAHPKVVHRGRELAQEVLDTPIGIPRTEFSASASALEPPGQYLRLLPLIEMTRVAAKLVAIAQDGLSSEHDRATAVRNLAYLVQVLPDDERRNAFTALWPLVHGPAATDVDVRLGRGALAKMVLTTTARAATDASHITEVERVVLERLPDTSRAASAAWAMIELKRTTRSHSSQLAAHDEPEVRQVAAILWSRDPSDPEVGRQLASDPCTTVRAQLARALRNLGSTETIRFDLTAMLASVACLKLFCGADAGQ